VSRASVKSSTCSTPGSQRLAAQDLLRPGLAVDEAAHILWLLSSFDAFDVLYTGRGLATGAVVEVLTATAERSLYA
jgi:hypothetical protein